MALLSWKEYKEKGSEKVEESIKKLNETTEEELLSIKGIGPKIAKKIISNLPFEDMNEVESCLSSTVVKKLVSLFKF